jgi:hypothetical protein
MRKKFSSALLLAVASSATRVQVCLGSHLHNPLSVAGGAAPALTTNSTFTFSQKRLITSNPLDDLLAHNPIETERYRKVLEGTLTDAEGERHLERRINGLYLPIFNFILQFSGDV